MKLKSLVMMALLCCFAVSASAQHVARLSRQVHAPNPDASVKTQQKGAGAISDAYTCQYTFTVAGHGNDYMEFCVTTGGNVVSFQSPNGVEYLYLGAIDEGYGVCDLDTGVAYYDYAEEGELNWNAPVTVSSSATSVKIARTTTDGVYTLTQIFTKVAGTTPYAKIEMQLKNNTAVGKEVYLFRWADIDPYPADNFLENFDSTYNSAWGYESIDYSGGNYAGYGLMLQNMGTPNVPYDFYGYVLDTSVGPAPCDPVASYVGPLTQVDGSAEMLYFLEIGAKKTATVYTRYLAF